MPHALVQDGVVVQLDLTGNPPEGFVPVSASVQPGYLFDGSDFLPPEPVGNGTPKTRTYKADIWRRATDEEAEQIDALLNSQPVRLRRLWADASFLSTTDELFMLILAGAEQLFGPARAAQLLEPTE
jgi:hypothetical protein